MKFYCNEIIFLYQKMGVKMPNCTGDVRKTTKTYKKSYINRPVSIYGIRWNIYHMLLVKILNSIATKYPFGPVKMSKWGSKCLIAPVMSEKHLKHIWNLILAGVYQFIGIRWNIYHMLLVKIWNSIATKYPFCAQTVKMGSKWGWKCLIALVMSEKHLKHIWNLILAGLYQFMEYVGISITCC